MEFLIARSHEALAEAHERLASSEHIGCDTETSGLSAQKETLYSIQFSNGDLSVLVPVSEGVHPGPLAGLLTDPHITKIFHNARFDLDFLSANSFKVDNVYCTMIAEKLIIKGARQSASLADTLYRHFGIDLDKSQRKKFNKDWNGKWSEELVRYALSDVVHLPKLMEEQRKWMETLDLLGEFERQMALIGEK